MYLVKSTIFMLEMIPSHQIRRNGKEETLIKYCFEITSSGLMHSAWYRIRLPCFIFTLLRPIWS